MVRVYLFIIGLLFFTSSIAQTAHAQFKSKIASYKAQDSLSPIQKDQYYNSNIVASRKTNNHESSAYSYYHKAFNLYVLRKPVDSVYFSLDKAVFFAKKDEEHILLSNLYSKYAQFLAIQENNQQALQYSDSAIVASKEVNYNYGIFSTYSTKSRIHVSLGNYDSSLENAFKAQEYASNKQDSISILKRLAYIYLYNEDYEQSKIYHKQVIDHSLINKTKIDSAYALQWMGNLADLYNQMDLQDQRKQQLDKSLQFSSYVPQEPYMRANILRQLADYHLKIASQIDSSSYFLNTIDKELPEIKELNFLADVNETRGDFYLKKDDYSKALEYYKETYTYYKGVNHLEKTKNIALQLSALYEKTQNDKLALAYFKEYQRANDSITNKEEIERFKEIELNNQFEKEKLQTQLAYQEELSGKQKIRNWLVFGLLSILGIAGFYSISYQRKKKQTRLLEEKNEIISKQLEEKKLLIREIHHRVKNNFQIVSNLLELQSNDIEDKRAKELAEEGQSRIRSMALIHKRLYENEDLFIQMDDYVRKLVTDISASYGSTHTCVVKYQLTNHNFDIDTAIPLGLIINELVTNAFKYGLQNQNPELSIMMTNDTNGKHILEVRDNGLGLPESFDPKKATSIGLYLVRLLSKQLHGLMTYEYDKGSVFKVAFKDTRARMLVA